MQRPCNIIEDAMKLFVWDLHGVLEVGNDLSVIDISNAVLESFGYKERFSFNDGSALYGLKWYEYFNWLLATNDYERDLKLQEACFELSESRLDLQCRWLQPTPGASAVLAEIESRHDQILISNTRPRSLDTFLSKLGYERFFSASNSFAVDGHAIDARRSKSDVLRRFLSDSAEKQYEDIVIIGDSPSDMKLKDVAGGTTYLYAHPGLAFRECVADHKIHDLRRVLDSR